MAGVGEQGGDMDRPGVVEDEGEREGSLVDEGSSGEAESPGSGLGGNKRLTEMEGGQEGTGEEEEGAVHKIKRVWEQLIKGMYGHWYKIM